MLWLAVWGSLAVFAVALWLAQGLGGMALFLLGYVVVQGDRLTVRAAGPPAGSAVAGFARPRLAPRCAALCKMAMGITMGYLLILML